MHLILYKMYTITTCGLALIYRATPFVASMTYGGTDQFAATLLAGGYNLVKPVLVKSKSLLAINRNRNNDAALLSLIAENESILVQC